ncbi:hypothetical protein NPS01_30020 [Nocardioides psychrotolerans]|uniref:Uncharacterized protein n=1 Tax=Nocardioides psychrotolerans TaxID=1005945 RepID=A0A1I3GLQ9_9ACTN|nr:hypothetical protein [Nocardioides psychrotolerans]GEP39339.1 hypothetical protein NPS01_30020 [Nocardioides psychrotolerans]SFI24172.1 hypothetical protein SAMN05216561_106180 [Nocardioides psychrotolerans]
MLAAAEPSATGLAATGLTGPTSYSPWLTWLAVLLVVLVVLYYAGVTWWARRPGGRRGTPALAETRRRHLARLDEVEASVGRAELSLRGAHQAISEIVRSFATAAGPLDARPLTLEQLRLVGPSGLVDVVALVYPPEFSPAAQGEPAERLAPALADARALVSDWLP